MKNFKKLGLLVFGPFMLMALLAACGDSGSTPAPLNAGAATTAPKATGAVSAAATTAASAANAAPTSAPKATGAVSAAATTAAAASAANAAGANDLPAYPGGTVLSLSDSDSVGIASHFANGLVTNGKTIIIKTADDAAKARTFYSGALKAKGYADSTSSVPEALAPAMKVVGGDVVGLYTKGAAGNGTSDFILWGSAKAFGLSGQAGVSDSDNLIMVITGTYA